MIYETDKKEVTSLLGGRGREYFTRRRWAISIVDAGARRFGANADAAADRPVVGQPNFRRRRLCRQAASQRYSSSPNFHFFTFRPAGGRGSGENLAGRLAGNSVDFARRACFHDGAFAANGNLCSARANKGTIIELEKKARLREGGENRFGAGDESGDGARRENFRGNCESWENIHAGAGIRDRRQLRVRHVRREDFFALGTANVVGDENGGDVQGKVAFYARSGNTSSPEKNWSAWSGPYKSRGETVTCPPARFIQWKAVFRMWQGRRRRAENRRAFRG